jgi:hypothetical protein
MNALDHRPKPPRPYERLPEYQQKIINEYVVELVEEIAKPREEAYIREILNLYIKQSCVLLHDSFKMTEDDLVLYIGSHKQFWRGQNRLVDRGEQEEYLNKRINEIFPNGFPQEFIDSLLSKVELVEGGQNG